MRNNAHLVLQRATLLVLSVVLAVGFLPANAIAEPPYALQAQQLPLSAQSVATALLPDANLYSAVKEQLSTRGIAFQNDDSQNTITVDVAQVTELDLDSKHIGSAAGLDAFTSLVSVDLRHNMLSDTAGFSALSQLRHLNLYDNFIHDFSGLSGLVSLEYLNAGENNEQAKGALAGMDAIATLTGLTSFDFSQNEAPSITGYVKDLVNLRFLNLQQNGIVDVSDLGGLANLQHLILSHNKITGIHALLACTELEELDLQSNNLYANAGASDSSGIDGLMSDAGVLALPKLKKLDICGNWNWNGFLASTSKANTDKLFALFQSGQLELGFSYDRIKSYDALSTARTTPIASLPHVDSSNIPYVTYDDFGVWCDGQHDDFNAMRNAHRYANTVGCEVRATAGRTYHVYRTWDLTYYNAYTSADWNGAKFIIHDENIDELGTRFVPLLCFHPSPVGTSEADSANKNAITLTNPGWTVTKQTTSLSAELGSQLQTLNAAGYDRYYVMVYDEAQSAKQYRRFGSNSNSGSTKWDGFIVDAAGKLEGPVQWDFNQVTKAIITPIPQTAGYLRNATFECTPLNVKAETPYHRGGNKPIYYLRNLQVRNATNFEVANIRHTVGNAGSNYDNNELNGSYTGFFTIDNCADVNFHDCEAWTRCYSEAGRSTYGITLNSNVNVTLENVNCSNPWEWLQDTGTRWGVMGTNHNKHILFEGCTLNRIDAHEGFYDMTARNCTLGSWGFRLTGQGPLLIEDCEVYANSFVMLRQDYGSTWDGDARIVNCTHHCTGPWSKSLMDVSPCYDDTSHTTVHDFGYDLRFPNLTIENFTVDFSTLGTTHDDYYIVPNHAYNDMHQYPESYWPSKVEIDGMNFVGYGDTLGYEPSFMMVSTDSGSIAGKVAGYHAKNVSYEGRNTHGSVKDGEQLLENPLDITSSDNKNNYVRLTSEHMGTREVAVEYTGTQPRLALMDEGWGGWTAIDAYYSERVGEKNVAYFSHDQLNVLWERANGGSGNANAFSRLRATTAGATHISAIALLDAPQETPDPVNYEIVLNPMGTWTKGSAGGYEISSDAPFDKFVRVEMDGTALDAAAYDASSGSTKVALRADYLETLPVGDHRATIVSSDGSATATITVQEAPSGGESEAGGDSDSDAGDSSGEGSGSGSSEGSGSNEGAGSGSGSGPNAASGSGGNLLGDTSSMEQGASALNVPGAAILGNSSGKTGVRQGSSASSSSGSSASTVAKTGDALAFLPPLALFVLAASLSVACLASRRGRESQ